ncbi:hypothetical protein JQK88_32095 [Mesorhizobium caraganae]|uniref:hypothetical protein n=1 Tax=Mesorhizobium caraganae TaxID=483206 RepID=UPI00193A8CA6|nr:hypothetical protein [Mesorhizobium caraganae]MBM2715753.1 hypothetical protein [Mesorhizobium caraganae]
MVGSLCIAIEFVADCLELLSPYLGCSDAAPSLGCPDGAAHISFSTVLAEGIRDHLGAPPFFAKHAFEQVGGSDRTPTGERKLEVSDGRFEVVNEAGHR